MSDDDFIQRTVRQLASVIARTTAAEMRAEADVERARADAALGSARDALRRGDAGGALTQLEAAIARLTHLPGTTSLRIDAGSLRALAPIGGEDRLASLFEARAEALEALGQTDAARASAQLADALRSR